MTDAAIDLAHDVLALVGDFLRKLPADQLTDLIAGEARLAVIPKGGRIVGSAAAAGSSRKTSATPKPTVSAEQVAADLSRIDNRPAAHAYVDDLQLTVPQLKQLCKAIGVPVLSKATKPDILRTIVELKVGKRLDADSIMRSATSPR